MIVRKILSNYKVYRPVTQEVEGPSVPSYFEDGSSCDINFKFGEYRYDLELTRVEVESLIHDLNNFIDDTKKGGK